MRLISNRAVSYESGKVHTGRVGIRLFTQALVVIAPGSPRQEMTSWVSRIGLPLSNISQSDDANANILGADEIHQGGLLFFHLIFPDVFCCFSLERICVRAVSLGNKTERKD